MDKTRRLGLVSSPSFSVHPALQLCHFLLLSFSFSSPSLYPWQSMGFLPYAFYLWSTNSQPAHFHLIQCLSLPSGYIFLDGKDWSDSSFYPHRVTQSLIKICSISRSSSSVNLILSLLSCVDFLLQTLKALLLYTHDLLLSICSCLLLLFFLMYTVCDKTARKHKHALLYLSSNVVLDLVHIRNSRQKKGACFPKCSFVIHLKFFFKSQLVGLP